MAARAIMLQGTGSDVGKSLIAAGLARLLANKGMKVSPFKPQNMSNNAAVTADGGEIGRAQALQARAARAAPSIHMNPILLKPETTTGAQVIVQGNRTKSMDARSFFKSRSTYLPAILDSFARVAADTDIVIVEGAGSPAEVNLRDGDIANMGFAHAAGVPVVLIGDIHRGGVIASIVGTFNVIDQADAERIKGFVINNFHGDVTLFADGLKTIETATGRPGLGVIPHFADAGKLPAEDAVALERAATTGTGKLRIAVPRLARIANFDDLDPLKLEPGVTLEIVQPGQPVPGNADLIVIPGSKSTIGDLAYLRRQGWDIDIVAHARRGSHVLGLCGGYQMLGRKVHDPDGLEGAPGSADGLGLLDIETTLTRQKTLTNVTARHVASNAVMSGYEIHLGETTGPDCARPFALIGDQPDGAISPSGRIAGTYMHGSFAADAFRQAYLASLGAQTSEFEFDAEIDKTLDDLASHLKAHLDIERILDIAESVK
ncbi:MAG: cobyric acid synthase [Rhizobiales bacterium]|nr:cobyric acid synthase [Hyphomicrobiales bacterium]